MALIGGARGGCRSPYATFGSTSSTSSDWPPRRRLRVSRGYRRLKMVVGRDASDGVTAAIDRRHPRRRAVAAVRRPSVPRSNLHRRQLQPRSSSRRTARRIVAPCGISSSRSRSPERRAADARSQRATGMPLACGQNEGLIFRFRDLLLNEAVDFVQPNVVSGVGFTQGIKVSGARRCIQRADGQRWRLALPQHASAGRHGQRRPGGDALLPSSSAGRSTEACREAEDGWLTLPAAPGLGFEPDRDAIAEIARSRRN